MDEIIRKINKKYQRIVKDLLYVSHFLLLTDPGEEEDQILTVYKKKGIVSAIKSPKTKERDKNQIYIL